MITGAQLREARALLGWERLKVAGLVDMDLGQVILAESVDGKPPLTAAQNAAVRAAFEAAGVIFVEENGEGPGARLRKGAS